MLFRPSKKVTFVMYQDEKVARAFEVEKTKLKALITTTVLIVFISVGAAVGLLANFRYLRESLSKKEPEIINILKNEKLALEAKIENLNKTNQEYLNKINTTKVETDSLIPLFARTLGQTDLRSRKMLNIEKLNLSFTQKGAVLNFDIVNIQKGQEKLSGYIFAVLKQGNKIAFYPDTSLEFSESVSSFGQGETFTISRFRQVKAEFDINLKKNQDVFVKIFIFNRTGDILHVMPVGPVVAN